jgi:flagellar hook assembly protein FlgD
VRPSTVQATLVGPGNVTLPIDAGPRAPGSYRFTWAGSGADSSAQPEGTWRFTVTSTDDRGQVSVSDRAFTLNNTLSALAVQPKLLTVGKKRTRLLATFKLRQSAKVTATVETGKGVVVRVLTRAQLAAGTRSLSWNGRVGAGGVAYGGAYQVHVVAANVLGRVDLYAPFRARR